MRREFAEYDGFLFDLDGCLYRGSERVPGAVELLGLLRNRGKKIGFLSNNSSQTALDVAVRLENMGIAAQPAEVWLPTDLAGEYLREHFGEALVYPIGSEAITASIRSLGLTVADAEEAACDVVFVARDVEFSFAKLTAATRFLQGGAALVAANPDSSHPGAAGLLVPETGALVAAIVEVTGAEVLLLGKPEPYLFQKALGRMGLSADQVVMVGDTLATDIAGARNAGLNSIWISEGRPVPPGASPGRICQELSDLLADLGSSINRSQGGNE